MTIDLDIGLLKKTDILGATIFSLLSHLQQGSFGCRITQTEIADKLHIARSTVSVRVKELSTLGLISYSNHYKRYFITQKS